nr:right-handed parallel beta-helix repeat-containing protein [uncultured Desulfobacter sp.]
MSYDAFLSYAHHDDLHEGEITALRSKIGRFVGDHLGRDAKIFQDKQGLHVGQVWKTELENALRCPCLIPIITPAYLNSDNCVNEFIAFAELEAKKQQTARILPLYYIEVPAVERRLGRPSQFSNQYNDKQLRVVNILVQRQMEDIRWLRTTPQDALSSGEGLDMLNRVAKQVAMRSAGANALQCHEVNPNGIGLNSISAAIQRAKPGEIIRVKGPAEYRESLFIDKPLQIVGEPGVKLIGVHGPAIACTGSCVRITGMQITAEGFNGVIVSSGYCILERTEVFGTKNSGVLIRDGAEAAVIECSLHDAEHCGLHAQHNGTKCTVVSSVITKNEVGGLFFSQNADGLVESNIVERNKVNGIYIASGANPLVRNNRIQRHNWAGILVYHHKEPGYQDYMPGRGIIEHNEISKGEQFGIEIKEGGNPCVRYNTITGNAWGGILTKDGGAGTIYENKIINNKGAGIKNEGGNPQIGKNLYADNAGKTVEDYGGATINDKVCC